MTRPLSVRIALAPILLSSFAVAQVTWSNASTTGAPAPYCGSCWDSGRDRLVAFGGALGATELNTMKEWDGTVWLTVNPTVRPSVRRRPAMVYDEARGVTVLFGGGAAFNNDTWTWNGTTWTQMTTPTAPAGRFGAAMAYDKTREVVVLFGGFVPSGQDTNDVWEWNGTTWSPRPSIGGVPIARGAHRMAYHEALQTTVLCGGYSTPQANTLSDVWSWNGTSWSQGPNLAASICDQVFAYDPTRQRIVLFGGLRITAGPVLTDLNATYEWHNQWTQRSPLSIPSSRNAGAQAYDPVNNRVLSAGGTTAAGITFADTWAYSPVSPASANSFGSPCLTTLGPVDLKELSLPYIGLPFEQQIIDASPTAAIGLVVFGGSNTTWNGQPLPFDLTAIGAPGCSLLVSLDVAVTVLLTNGSGIATWNLPNLASAVGFQFFTQGVVLDPSSPLPFQVDMTSARQLVIGNP